MKRFRLGPATVLAAVALAAAGSPQPAIAAADPNVGKQVLDEMCRDKGGQAFFTPFTISRCQEARSRKGFELEALICEGLLAGRFSAVDSPLRNNRTNWACISGPSPA